MTNRTITGRNGEGTAAALAPACPAPEHAAVFAALHGKRPGRSLAARTLGLATTARRTAVAAITIAPASAPLRSPQTATNTKLSQEVWQ